MHDLADLTTLNLPEHLAPSYCLALQEQLKKNTFVSFSAGTVEIDGVELPSITVVNDDAFQTWHTETLAMFDAMTMPSVATVANFKSMPYFTPSMMFYLNRARKGTAPRAALKSTESKKRKPSQAPVEASKDAPGTEDQKEAERALVAS